jgi:tryptophan synthase alpha subunit
MRVCKHSPVILIVFAIQTRSVLIVVLMVIIIGTYQGKNFIDHIKNTSADGVCGPDCVLNTDNQYKLSCELNPYHYFENNKGECVLQSYCTLRKVNPVEGV